MHEADEDDMVIRETRQTANTEAQTTKEREREKERGQI
jgi:hypothetical protein